MRFLTTFLFSILFLSLVAQEGYEITVEIDGYEEEELYLAYYLGDKQYIQDTVIRSAKGDYTFKGEEALKGGIYLVVMAPDNNFFQILVDDTNQHFSLKTKAGAEQMPSTKFKNSKVNEDFYDYLKFLADQRPLAEAIQKRIAETDDESKKASIQQELEDLNANVLKHQRKIVAENPKSLNAVIINSNLPLDIPDYEGSEEEVNTKKWRWMQKHYFDNIALDDSRMLRTPFLMERVNYFIEKLQVQHPDTLSQAIDFILGKMAPSEDNFKYYLIHFLNHYAASKFVGMDAVYVHLVEKYYAKGKAPWTEEEQLTKILDNAAKLKPLLIGKTAPNILMQRKDGSQISLNDVDASYTILYFWRYDCGHCKKSTPHLKAFYDAFKDQDIKIFAACAKLRDEVPACWDYIDEQGIGDWIHVVDPYGRSRFMQYYDLRSTPQIYILDKDKKIISKRLGAEQLPEFFNSLLGTNIEVEKVIEKEEEDHSDHNHTPSEGHR